MNKTLTIKQKILVFTFLIQFITLGVFSYSLYKVLQISAKDKVETSLKVILRDVKHDLLKSQDNLSNKEFDEEDEFEFKPLFIRVFSFEQERLNTNHDLKIPLKGHHGNTYYDYSGKNKHFPLKGHHGYAFYKNLDDDTVLFEEREGHFLSTTKLELDNKQELIVQIATPTNVKDDSIKALLNALYIIVPILVLLSTLAGNFLLYKFFSPVETVLHKLKHINAHALSKRLGLRGNNDEIDLLIKEINSLLERLEQSFERVSQFSSDASHELKTPLTIIRGEVEVNLRKERSNEEYQSILKSILDEIIIIQKTTDDLLFLAKNEEQGLSGLEDVYLDEISQEATEQLQGFAKLKKVNLVLAIDELITTTGNAQLLKIAIKNILKNAISYSYENTEVIVRNSIKNNTCIISVQDFGIGIKPQEQKKIFEKFYRTDKSRSKHSGGTGLGMAIVSKIVHMHHGRIEVESKENTGTTMSIILPFKQQEF